MNRTDYNTLCIVISSLPKDKRDEFIDYLKENKKLPQSFTYTVKGVKQCMIADKQISPDTIEEVLKDYDKIVQKLAEKKTKEKK